MQAGHEDDRGGLRGKFEAGCVAAQELDELVADDLDDLLGGRKCRKHFASNGFHADVFDELVDDIEVDVGLEHGDANLFQSLIHVFFGERALPPKVFEGPLQFFCKVLKHRSDSSVSKRGGAAELTGSACSALVATLARLLAG